MYLSIDPRNIIKVGWVGKMNFTPHFTQAVQTTENQSCWEFTGGYDDDRTEGFKHFRSLNELLLHNDAIVVNDLMHAGFRELQHIIRNCRHVLVRQPFPLSTDELTLLHRLSEEAQVVVQMGFMHRFTDLFQSVSEKQIVPRLIENSHFMRFKRRSTQLSIISDVLLEDLDLITQKVQSDIKSIHATGVGVIYNDPDIINIRIEFQNACIANISGSKIAIKDIHKTRFYQNNSYYTLDHIQNSIKVFNTGNDAFWENTDESDALSGSIETFDKQDANDLTYKEFTGFIDAIRTKSKSRASLYDHIAIKFVAEKIYDQLERNFVAKCG